MGKRSGEALGFDWKKEDGGLRVTAVAKGGDSTVGKWNELHEGRVDEPKEGQLIVGFKGESGMVKDLEQLSAEVERLNKEGEEGDITLMLADNPYTTDEILAILCHEIGHWHHGHVTKMLVVSSVHIFLLFRLYAVVMNSPTLLSSFGFDPKEESVMASLSIFMLMLSPVETVLNFAMVTMTRMNEYQADEFAVKQKRAAELSSGLRKLCVENLGDLNPDPWYAWFHHTHPALVERLQAIKAKELELTKKDK